MTTIVITLKDGQITTDGGIDIAASKSKSPTTDSRNINHHLDPDTVIDLLGRCHRTILMATDGFSGTGSETAVCVSIEITVAPPNHAN